MMSLLGGGEENRKPYLLIGIVIENDKSEKMEGT
jgi:hypothetical protein